MNTTKLLGDAVGFNSSLGSGKTDLEGAAQELAIQEGL
jgi:hypothetical protein